MMHGWRRRALIYVKKRMDTLPAFVFAQQWDSIEGKQDLGTEPAALSWRNACCISNLRQRLPGIGSNPVTAAQEMNGGF